VHRQVIDYVESTGDVYEDISHIGFRSESDREELSEFLYFGDMQPETSISEYEETGKLIESAIAAHPRADLVLQSGDLTNSGEAPEEWDALLAMLRGSLNGLPFMTAPGNHEFSPYTDTEDRLPEKYLESFDLPQNGPEGYEELYYSFDCGGAHVLSLAANYLDPAESYSADATENERRVAEIDEWIRADLEGTDKPWKIVLTHQPAFPIEGDSTAAGMRERWLPIFEETGVDLVLCGHQHEFLRTFPLDADGNTVSADEGIVEIMGNASAKSYDTEATAPDFAAFEMGGVRGYHDITITPDKLTVKAFDETGRELDHWEKT
jgi:3',5'-cyclic AMP phosphodiesterase CpdA